MKGSGVFNERAGPFILAEDAGERCNGSLDHSVTG